MSSSQHPSLSSAHYLSTLTLYRMTTCRDANKPWWVYPLIYLKYCADAICVIQTFTCFVFLDLVSALQNRGLGCGITQNKMLLTTVSASFITQLTLIYVPFMQSIFQTAALDFDDLATLLGLACVSAGLHEVRRRYERSKNAELTYAHATEELA